MRTAGVYLISIMFCFIFAILKVLRRANCDLLTASLMRNVEKWISCILLVANPAGLHFANTEVRNPAKMNYVFGGTQNAL